jgi:mannose-6-phosphate isomerase-like protein (cupin superfamily)
MNDGAVDAVPARGNSKITKVVHHQNFQGGYIVGLSVATHEPDTACGEHDHRGAIEQFFVLDGFGIITVDGVEHHVEAGDSVLVPAGVMHNVAAAPTDTKNRPYDWPFTVQCMLVVAPGHEDDPKPWEPTSAA